MADIRSLLTVIERNVQRWKDYRQATSDSTRAREERLTAYEELSRQIDGDDGDTGSHSGRGFRRTRAHRLVDGTNDLYGYALLRLTRQANGNLPFVVGARDGRVGTGPLRRYIDGVTQRQALAILCKGCRDFGRPLSKHECAELGKQATDLLNRISGWNASKESRNAGSSSSSSKIGVSSAQQKKAVRMLQLQMKNQSSTALLPAMSTGSGGEVIISGVGAVATCRNMNGTMKPGKTVMVRIEGIDAETGKVVATIDTSTSNK
jgi:hypothetical protein